MVKSIMRYIIVLMLIWVTSISLNADINISINDVEKNEGDSGTTSFDFKVSIDQNSSEDINITYEVSHDSTNSADLNTSTGTAKILAGDMFVIITILVNGDDDIESSERFFVNISNSSSGNISDSIGIGKILNDDTDTIVVPDNNNTDNNNTDVYISINNVTNYEGNRSTTSFDFNVSIDKIATTDVSVDYSISAGSADLDTDVRQQKGVALIREGDRSTLISVLVNGDMDFEPNERFYVNLSQAIGAKFSNNKGAGTILNDDSDIELWYKREDLNDTSVKYEHIKKKTFILIDNSGSDTIDIDDVSIELEENNISFIFEEEGQEDMLDTSVSGDCKIVTYKAYVHMHKDATVQTGFKRLSSSCQNMKRDSTAKDNIAFDAGAETVLRRPSSSEKKEYGNANIVIISDIDIDNNITLGDF